MSVLTQVLKAANRPGTALLRAGEGLAKLPGAPRDLQRVMAGPAVQRSAQTLDRIPDAIRGPASTATPGQSLLAGGQRFAAQTGDPRLQRAWQQPILRPVAQAVDHAGRALADTYHATTLSGIRASSNLGPQWARFQGLPVMRAAGTGGTAVAVGGLVGGAAERAAHHYWRAPQAATEAAGLDAQHAEPFQRAVTEQRDSGALLGKLLVPDALAGRTPGEKEDRSLALQGIGEGVRQALADPTPGPLAPIEHASEYATPYHYLLGHLIARARQSVQQTAAATPPPSLTPQVVGNTLGGRLGPLQEEAVKGRYRQAQDQIRPYWEAAKKWRADHGL